MPKNDYDTMSWPKRSALKGTMDDAHADETSINSTCTSKPNPNEYIDEETRGPGVGSTLEDLDT
jgi:hypothetical protein